MIRYSRQAGDRTGRLSIFMIKVKIPVAILKGWRWTPRREGTVKVPEHSKVLQHSSHLLPAAVWWFKSCSTSPLQSEGSQLKILAPIQYSDPELLGATHVSKNPPKILNQHKSNIALGSLNPSIDRPSLPQYICSETRRFETKAQKRVVGNAWTDTFFCGVSLV